MKKLIATLMMVASIGAVSNAQVFDKGAKFAHVGIGVGSPYAYSGSSVSIPPVHASLEVGITEKIGIGGLIGYTASTWDQNYFGDAYSWKFTYLIIGARGAYHFIDNEKADVYGGLMLGYNVASAKFESADPDLEAEVGEPEVGGVAFGGYVGARYMFKENIGGFAELGYNISYLSIGATFKF
jgi:hypothetical protein